MPAGSDQQPGGDGSPTAAAAGRFLTFSLTGLAVLIVLGIGGALIAVNRVNSSATRHYVNDALPLQQTVQDLVLQLVNEETSVRGYLITGRATSLDTYRAARPKAVIDLAQLRARVPAHPELAGPYAQAVPEIKGLDSYFSQQIDRVRAGHVAAARRLVEAGKQQFDAFRATIDNLNQAVAGVVARAKQSQRDTRNETYAAVGALGLAAVTIALVFALWLPRRIGGLLRRLEQERERTGALQSVTAELAGETSPDRVADVTTRRALEIAEAAVAGIYLADDMGRTLRRIAVVDSRPNADPANEYADLAIDGTTPGAVAYRSGEEAWLLEESDWERYGPELVEFIRRRGRLGLGLVPLTSGRGSEGVFFVSFPLDRPPDAEARALTRTLAQQASQALERGRLLEIERRGREDADRVHAALAHLNAMTLRQGTDAAATRATERAVCEAARVAFDADAAALWLRSGETIRLLVRVPGSAALPVGSPLSLTEYPSFADALERGRPSHISDLAASDPRVWEDYARHTGARAQLRIPLAPTDEAQNLLVVSWLEVRPAPGAHVLELGARFGDQSARVLAEAARRTSQQEAARLHQTLEQGLLPVITVTSPRVRVASLYRPGEERLRLGGDFYDYVEKDGRISLVVGDVAGHGPEAAALGASLRAAWTALSLLGLPAEEILTALSGMVRKRRNIELFATLCHVELDPAAGRVQLAVAGHPQPIMRAESATPLRVEAVPPLGVGTPPADWPVAEAVLPPGATLVLYTDGLVEGRAMTGSADRWGVERLIEALSETRDIDSEAGLTRVLDRAVAANGGPLDDDVAVLAVTLDAEPGASRESADGDSARAGVRRETSAAP
jgi:serine phosphatase RsbU (regulator of sigma subunit)/CHASE3 domain sensor protein